MGTNPNRDTTADLQDLVARIRTVANPVRIILFGSAARGEAGAQDLDVLVVAPEGAPRRHTAQRIHQALWGFPRPVDVLVVTPDLLERHRDNIGLIYRAALAEGRDIYAAPAA